VSEALRPVIDIAFARADIDVLTATTDPANRASQNILRKAGLRCLGLFPRRDPASLRGSAIAMRWQLTREDYVRQRQETQPA
jgi:RimJ/RimL family protein N-acetyltransferase